MTGPHDIDPTGAYGVRPDAGQRTEFDPDFSEWADGGLLARGTVVRAQWINGGVITEGPIVDRGATPAPYVSIQSDLIDGHVVVFLGPGVFLTPVSAHPALD